MSTFGIISEGITDQIVIEQVILGCFDGDEEEPVVNYVQPLLDRTGQSAVREPGGWTLVFRYLELGKHREALQFNDYLILHIDTDVCEEKGYDVPRREGGRELTPEELVALVVEKLRRLLGADVVKAHGHRILYAVAVDGIECWLLPLLLTNKKARKITGCLAAMNHERRKRNLKPLSKADGSDKDPRAYLDASRPYADGRNLRKLQDRNASLALFVAQVPVVRLMGRLSPDFAAS